MKPIQLLILDVDGVLTDGTIWLTGQGDEGKCFHMHDGVGIQRIQAAGVTVAIISGGNSTAVSARMTKLGVTHVYQNCQDKLTVFRQLLKELALTPDQAAYIGDDLPDLPVMQQVGLSIAVANACDAIKAIAHWQTEKNGGMGAVREACDRLLTENWVATAL